MHRGISGAMRRAGVEVVDYSFASRMVMSGKFLKMVNREAKRNSPDAPQFNTADTLYHASVGLLERALRHEADWVFIISALYLHHDVLLFLRRAGIKTACLLTESPYDDQRERAVASLVDVIFTNERASVATFEPYCHEAHYYQHAYDPAFHKPLAEVPDGMARHDVVFVGTGFRERIELLSRVDWTGIDLGLYGTWKNLGSRAALRKYVRGDIVPNEVTAQLYAASKIGLNLHRARAGWTGAGEPVQAESMNPRCYELAATGTMFTTDARAEVGEVFGDAVPTFSDARELQEIIRHYLAHEDERRRLAARLPGLVAPHTFEQRVAGILQVLTRYH